MYAILDYQPRYCPNCGHRFTHGPYEREDFNARASFECRDCQASYQKADTDAILNAAEAAGGDMKRMARR